MKSIAQFEVDSKNKSLSAFISDLNGFDGNVVTGPMIVLVGNTGVTNWHVYETEHKEGDLVSWTLRLSPLDIKAHPGRRNWKMVIFND